MAEPLEADDDEDAVRKAQDLKKDTDPWKGSFTLMEPC
jgi:hypothetical protein